MLNDFFEDFGFAHLKEIFFLSKIEFWIMQKCGSVVKLLVHENGDLEYFWV
jgi:hypothetical protein